MFDESVIFLFLLLSTSLLNITDSRYSHFFLYGIFEFGWFAFHFIVILFAIRGFDFLI